MKFLASIILSLFVVRALPAEIVRFDAGTFAVTLEVNPYDWHIEVQPMLGMIRFQKQGTVGPPGKAGFQSFVYADRIAGDLPKDLNKWFSSYLNTRSNAIRKKIFTQPVSFRLSKKGVPITVGRLLRFDMAPFRVSRFLDSPHVEEEGLIYFYLLPGFEEHRTFFVFTGHQALSRELGHRSEMFELDNILRGFELTVPRKG